LLRGEIHQALKNDIIQQNEITELGDLVNGDVPGRISDDQVTVADLTGVAVQDIQIAKAVFESVLHNA
jgi:ornithine cyclodeaminase